MVDEGIQIWALVTFGLSVLCALISCGASVISYQNARKPASVELQSTVDECVALIEKLLKDQRKERMSRVRNSTRDSVDPETAPISSSMLDAQPTNEGSYAAKKAQLRQLARAAGRV